MNTPLNRLSPALVLGVMAFSTAAHSGDYRDDLEGDIFEGVAGAVAGQIAGDVINDSIIRGHEKNYIDPDRPRSRVNIERGDVPRGHNDYHYVWCYNNYSTYNERTNAYVNNEGKWTECVSPER